MKKGDRVVCIEDYWTIWINRSIFTKGETYEVVGLKNYTPYYHITYYHITLIDDNGMEYSITKNEFIKFFESIEAKRKRLIEVLIS